MIRATTFAGQTVAVFGLGGSGQATAASLRAGGATVAAWDDGEASRAAAAKAGVQLVDLRTADWSRFAALVLAPGVPLTHPEPHWTVQAAEAAGIEVIGDIEIFCRERRAQAPDTRLIAITGTNGKSTTTALVAHLLGAAGFDVQMGGNIGRAILTLDNFNATSSVHALTEKIYVIEMSTFQIDLAPSLDPTIGVHLNLSADHLDRHGPADDPATAMRNYAAIKERLVAGAEVALVGVDDQLSADIFERLAQRNSPDTYPVSVKSVLDWGWMRKGAQLGYKDFETADFETLGNVASIPTLRGLHNAQNALFALATAWHAGLDLEQMASTAAALKSYPGLPHRMEQVGREGRVLFLNDSKATNADSTEKALAAFDRDIYWIAGGKPKEGGIRALESYFPRIAKAYLIGQASDDFASTLDGRVDYVKAGTLEAALAAAAADAARSEGAEPVVLLSPACASYDQFRSFEHRGDTFRALVRSRPGVAP